MIFRQLFDKDTSTYTYLVGDATTRQALLIDPVLEQIERDWQLVRDLQLSLGYTLDTHTHADHITGAGGLRQKSGCQIAVGANSQVVGADVWLKDGDRLRIGGLVVEVLETPGHTDESLCYKIGPLLFSGDTLLVRGCGRTDFQNGSAAALYESVTRKLFALPDDTLVYPGHDYKGHTVSSIGEEKRLNPRLTLGKAGFIQEMESLNLPNPQRIKEAVPANLRCGLLDPAS